MVAGISAAAIAVTQTAIVPIDIFAATQEPVVSDNVGFSLKLDSKNDSKHCYDGDYVLASAGRAILNGDKITADGSNGALAFSFGGDIKNEAITHGDQYTFTAEGLKITANTKGGTFEETEDVKWRGSTNLDDVAEEGSLSVPNAGSTGDTVEIEYNAAIGSSIKVVDSEGNDITADSDTDGVFTFKLTDKSASEFLIKGDGISVLNVKVTAASPTNLTKDINEELVTGLSKNVTLPDGSAAGDTAELYYHADGDVIPTNLAVAGALNVEDDGVGKYTFTITEDMVENGMTITGDDGYTLVDICVYHRYTTTLSYNGAFISDTKETVTVGADQFANATTDQPIRVYYSTENENASPKLIVTAGKTDIGFAEPGTDAGLHTFDLDADKLAAVKKNGIKISGEGLTVTGVVLVNPEKEIASEEITLFSSDDPVVWSQTFLGYWDGEQSIDTSSISDKIGTIDAFNNNFENITATWDSFTATKKVYAEGEVWSGSTDLGTWGNTVLIPAVADAEEGGTLTVEYTASANPQIKLVDNGADNGWKWTDLTNVYDLSASETSFDITVNADTAASLKKGQTLISGQNATVTSVKYKAKAEEPDPGDDEPTDPDVKTIWKGSFDLGEWKNNFTTMGAYSKAVKDGELTVNYTVNSGAEYAQFQFKDSGNASNNYKWTDLTEVLNLDLSAASYKLTLTEKMAESVAAGQLVIGGANVTITSVTYKAPASSGDEPAETTIFEGETDLTTWAGNQPIDAFEAKKGGKITAEFTENSSSDYWQIKFTDSSWKALTSPKTNEWGAVDLASKATSYTFTLNAADAKAITESGMVISGYGITLKKLTYTAPASAAAVELTDFKDANFRNVIKAYSTDGKTLSEADIAKITELGCTVAERTALAKVKKFDGIEYLTALKKLDISENGTAVTALDLSQNDALTDLYALNATKLASVKLPASMILVHITNAAISEFDTSAMTELKDLRLDGTKLTSLDVSKNTKLEFLSITNVSINSIDLTANTALTSLLASNCGLETIDVSKNTELIALAVSKNHLTSLDLTGLDNLNQLYVDGNVRNIGTVVDGEFDLSTVIDDFDVSKVSDVVGAEMDENGKLTGITGKVTYAYSSGNSINIYDKIIFTLEPEKLVTVYFYVGKMGSDDEEDDDLVPFEKWDDVVKYINTANDSKASYVIGVDKDVTIDKFTFPAASKAKEIYISSYGESTQTITTKAATIALPTTVGFTDINVKSTAKTFTMSASKDLALDNAETNLTAIKGGAKSTLTLDCPHASISDITADVSGFGTIHVDGTTKFSNTVKATNLVLGSGSTVYFTNTASATFTNIKSEEKSNPGYIQYIKNDDGYKQITVTGEILNPVYIGLADEEGRLLPFAEKDIVLTAKTADFTNISITGDAKPEGTTLARVGSDVKVLPIAVTLSYTINGEHKSTQFAQWSDVLNTIAANAKAGSKDISYTVTLTKDLDVNGAFKMPAAKTYSELNFVGYGATPSKITFTGNITLTGKTAFENVVLDSVKKVKNEFVPYTFTIAAGKNELTLADVTTTSSIKSLTSSGTVNLTGVELATINAAIINVSEGDTFKAMSSINDIADGEAAWDGKDISKSSVVVTGNLTAKTALNFVDESSLTVKGILNAVNINADTADSAVLVVYQQAKNKTPLVIGKNGFSNNAVKLVLADPDTDKTAQIVEKTVFGTIAGPYADQLIPSDDNLAETDEYYIIKDGKNLVAVPKTDSENNKYLVEVRVNGRTAYYKTLDEAIKDINATGKKTDDLIIKLTPEMFEGTTLAKLPLPSAGKYESLYYTADSEVTINVTSDLALTGDLTISNKITINKVDKKSGAVQPINISLGKYELTIFNVISADHSNGEAFAPSSMIGNITGTGIINMTGNIVISGKVAKTVTFYAHDASIILDGAKSAFEGTIAASSSSSTAIFTYDKSNVKNVKFQNITGFSKFTLAYRGEDEIAEGDIIASIAGDYSDQNTVTAGSTYLVVVRSGNYLKAVSMYDVLKVYEYSESPFGDDTPNLIATRSYDTFANAVKDIERIKNPSGVYSINAKDGNELVLPKAKTYDTLIINGRIDVTSPGVEAKVDTITTAKDLTLTGNLVLMNINLDKVVKGAVQPMSINLGNYSFMAYNGHISYDADKKASQLTNVNGKGTFGLMDNMTISGKVNVGTFIVNSVITFGDKAGFAASTEITVGEGFDGNYPEFIYPLAAAKNIDLSNIDTGKEFNITVDGAKEGDQVAAVKGDMVRYDITLNDGDLIIVRSGNKLIAAKEDTEFELRASDQSIRLFDTYDNAVAYITKLNNKNAIYEITLPESADKIELKKLTLPAKGKYDGLSITASNTHGTKVIVNSDIALTGNLALKGELTLMKDGEKLLKITSPLDSKTKQPLYQFTLVGYANVVNGTFNGTPIENPEAEKTTIGFTLPYSDENGTDLSKYIMTFGTTRVYSTGISVTLKETVTSSIVLYDAHGNKLVEAAPSEGRVKVVLTPSTSQAEKILESGFSIGGTEGIVTAVAINPPEASEAKADGYATFNSNVNYDLSLYDVKVGADNSVAANGTITVTLKEEVTSSIEFKKTASDTALKTVTPTGNTYTWVLTADEAAYIKENGFYICGTEGTVTGVEYTKPPVIVSETQTIGFTNASWDLSEYVLSIGAADVVEKGTITITFEKYVTNAIKLLSTSTETLGTATVNDETNSITFTLSSKMASAIKTNGFYIVGDAGVVTSVTYKAPESSSPDDGGSED